MNNLKILNVRIDKLTLDQAVKRVQELVTSKITHLIVTANPEIVMLAREDAEFSEILAGADMVTADGIGLVIASRIINNPLPMRVTGIDLSTRLFQEAVQQDWKIFLLGAAPGVAKEAAANLQSKYPGLKIVGVQNGYFSDDDAVIAEVNQAQPDLLLVALGMGKQEKWIWQNRQRLEVPVCIGVGGSLDVYAGRVQRAPYWMQRLGIEWLYRLIKQPSRLGRMMVLPYFLWLVVVNRILPKRT